MGKNHLVCPCPCSPLRKNYPIWEILARALRDQGQFTDECEDALRCSLSDDVENNEDVFRLVLRWQINRIQTAAAARTAAARYAHFDKGGHVFLSGMALVSATHSEPLVRWFFLVAAATGHTTGSLAVLSASPIARELEPLLVAFQMLEGQMPNAPYEILEVAKDVVKQVEAIRAKMATPAPPTTPKASAAKRKTVKSR